MPVNWFLSRDYLLQWRRLNFCSVTFSATVGFKRILYMTEAFSLYIWRALFKLLGMITNLSSVYHQQWANGKIQEISRFLYTFLLSPPKPVESLLVLGWVCIKLTPATLYKAHPLSVLSSYQPLLFKPLHVPSVDHCFRESEKVLALAHQHLQRAVRHQKSHVDGGDPPIPNTSPGRKCGSPWRTSNYTSPARTYVCYIGPFTKTFQNVPSPFLIYKSHSKVLSLQWSPPCLPLLTCNRLLTATGLHSYLNYSQIISFVVYQSFLPAIF